MVHGCKGILYNYKTYCAIRILKVRMALLFDNEEEYLFRQ